MRTSARSKRWYLFPLAVVVGFAAWSVAAPIAVGDPGNRPNRTSWDRSAIQVGFDDQSECGQWTVLLSSGETETRARGQVDRWTHSSVDVWGYDWCDGVEYIGSADVDPAGTTWDLSGGTMAGSVVVEVWAMQYPLYEPYFWGTTSVDFDVTLTATGESTTSRSQSVDHYRRDGVREGGVFHDRYVEYEMEVTGSFTTDLPGEWNLSQCSSPMTYVSTGHQLGWWQSPELPVQARRPT